MMTSVRYVIILVAVEFIYPIGSQHHTSACLTTEFTQITLSCEGGNRPADGGVGAVAGGTPSLIRVRSAVVAITDDVTTRGGASDGGFSCRSPTRAPQHCQLPIDGDRNKATGIFKSRCNSRSQCSYALQRPAPDDATCGGSVAGSGRYIYVFVSYECLPGVVNNAVIPTVDMCTPPPTAAITSSPWLYITSDGYPEGWTRYDQCRCQVYTTPGRTVTLDLLDLWYEGEEENCVYTVEMSRGYNAGEGPFHCDHKGADVVPLGLRAGQDGRVVVYYHTTQQQQQHSNKRFWLLLKSSDVANDLTVRCWSGPELLADLTTPTPSTGTPTPAAPTADVTTATARPGGHVAVSPTVTKKSPNGGSDVDPKFIIIGATLGSVVLVGACIAIVIVIFRCRNRDKGSEKNESVYVSNNHHMNPAAAHILGTGTQPLHPPYIPQQTQHSPPRAAAVGASGSSPGVLGASELYMQNNRPEELPSSSHQPSRDNSLNTQTRHEMQLDRFNKAFPRQPRPADIQRRRSISTTYAEIPATQHNGSYGELPGSPHRRSLRRVDDWLQQIPDNQSEYYNGSSLYYSLPRNSRTVRQGMVSPASSAVDGIHVVQKGANKPAGATVNQSPAPLDVPGRRSSLDELQSANHLLLQNIINGCRGSPERYPNNAQSTQPVQNQKSASPNMSPQNQQPQQPINNIHQQFLQHQHQYMSSAANSHSSVASPAQSRESLDTTTPQNYVNLKSRGRSLARSDPKNVEDLYAKPMKKDCPVVQNDANKIADNIANGAHVKQSSGEQTSAAGNDRKSDASNRSVDRSSTGNSAATATATATAAKPVVPPTNMMHQRKAHPLYSDSVHMPQVQIQRNQLQAADLLNWRYPKHPTDRNVHQSAQRDHHHNGQSSGPPVSANRDTTSQMNAHPQHQPVSSGQPYNVPASKGYHERPSRSDDATAYYRHQQKNPYVNYGYENAPTLLQPGRSGTSYPHSHSKSMDSTVYANQHHPTTHPANTPDRSGKTQMPYQADHPRNNHQMGSHSNGLHGNQYNPRLRHDAQAQAKQKKYKPYENQPLVTEQVAKHAVDHPRNGYHMPHHPPQQQEHQGHQQQYHAQKQQEHPSQKLEQQSKQQHKYPALQQQQPQHQKRYPQQQHAQQQQPQHEKQYPQQQHHAQQQHTQQQHTQQQHMQQQQAQLQHMEHQNPEEQDGSNPLHKLHRGMVIDLGPLQSTMC